MSERDPRQLGEALRRAADGVTPREVDTEAVLAASRSSRRSRRTALVGTAASVAGILATVGIVAALAGLPRSSGGFDAASSEAGTDAPAAAEAESQESDATDAAGGAEGIRLAPPEKVNTCGAPVAPPTDPSGADGGLPLEVVVAADGVVAPGADASVRVTVTNRGTAPLRGTLRLDPVTVVADDGVTVWHTSGLADAPARFIELAPGAATVLDGVATAVRCTVTDEELPELPPGLPPLEAGAYGVGAIVVFTPEAATAPAYLISPLATLSVG